MDPLVIGIIVIAALAIIGVVLWQQQRTRRLQTRYVSEYDRTVAELGRRRGEAELVSREERVRQLDIRPLSAAERERFVADWRHVQEQFVDDPRGAVTRGDQLVDEVMRARGYPIADFDRQIADLSNTAYVAPIMQVTEARLFPVCYFAETIVYAMDVWPRRVATR